jgi:hypothetical protein
MCPRNRCKLWRQKNYRLSAMGGHICEIKSMAISNFILFSVNHCFRECNKVTHAVAAIDCKYPYTTNRF